MLNLIRLCTRDYKILGARVLVASTTYNYYSPQELTSKNFYISYYADSI